MEIAAAAEGSAGTAGGDTVRQCSNVVFVFIIDTVQWPMAMASNLDVLMVPCYRHIMPEYITRIL